MLLFDKTKFIIKYYIIASWWGNSNHNVNSGNQNGNKVSHGNMNFGDEELEDDEEFKDGKQFLQKLCIGYYFL